MMETVKKDEQSPPLGDPTSDDEETADTLKASDLTAADLAALAALAKKKSGPQLLIGKHADGLAAASPASPVTKIGHVSPRGHVKEILKSPIGNMAAFEDDEGDDAGWAEDFDLQDDLKELGARSRLLRDGGSRDDTASEGPSTVSLSEFTTDTSEGRASQQAPEALNKHAVSDRAPSSSVSSIISAANPSTISKAGGDAPLVIGDMLFDAKRLCWVRRDGKEDEDPFGSDFDEGPDERPESRSTQSSKPADNDRAKMEESLSRFVRHAQSDSPVSGFEGSSSSSAEPPSTMSKAISRMTRKWNGTLRRKSSNSSSTYRELVDKAKPLQYSDLVDTIKQASQDQTHADQIPSHLAGYITADLWRTSLQALSRHTIEMAGLIPRSIGTDTSARAMLPPITITSRSSSLPKHGKVAKSSFFGRVSKAPQETAIKEKTAVTLTSRPSASRLYLLREMAAKRGKNKATAK